MATDPAPVWDGRLRKRKRIATPNPAPMSHGRPRKHICPSDLPIDGAQTTASEDLRENNSPLLALPGEILNIVYEYALTRSPSYLHLNRSTAGPACLYETNQSPEEFNQLKFVCRKMYAETAGLELKYNIIVLEHKRTDSQTDTQTDSQPDSETDSETDSEGPDVILRPKHNFKINIFLALQRTMTPHWSNHIREVRCVGKIESIYVGYMAGITRRNLRGLIGFCRANPQTTIRVEIGGFDQSNIDLLMASAYFNRMLRGSCCDHDQPHNLCAVCERVRSWRVWLGETDSLAPTNLRLMPVGRYDEEAIRGGMDALRRFAAQPPPTFRRPLFRSTAAFMEAVKGWFANGL